MGLNHKLQFINIMTPDGKINENGGSFAGMTKEEAREAVVEAMKELGFLEKIEPHKNRVGISYRSKAVIEPYMSKQWFVRMTGFKEKLRSAVRREKSHASSLQLGKHLFPLDRQPARLVHLPPALVGTSHPHLVPQRRS